MVYINKKAFQHDDEIGYLYNVHKKALWFLWKPEKGRRKLTMLDNIIISGFADEMDMNLD